MELFSGDFTIEGPVAILPGSFNPPTVAHLGLAEAALARVATVVFTLPRVFPHKNYAGIGQSGRMQLLRELTRHQPRFALAVSEGGLFVEMAREFRQNLKPGNELFFLCGRDAADRILSWDYLDLDPIEDQLDEFKLLVAARQGAFVPPSHLRHRMESLTVESNWDAVSSTAVREAMEIGGPWQHLVPSAIHEDVKRIYAASFADANEDYSPSRLDSRNVRNR